MSDRYEAARKALAAYERGAVPRVPTRYETELATALRALIEASATTEAANDIAMSLWGGADAALVVATRGQHPRMVALLGEAVRAGMQAAQPAPTFRPEGVPDVYRDAWEKIVYPDDNAKWGVGLKLYGPRGETDVLDISEDQARRILAMLSSEDADQ